MTDYRNLAACSGTMKSERDKSKRLLFLAVLYNFASDLIWMYSSLVVRVKGEFYLQS